MNMQNTLPKPGIARKAIIYTVATDGKMVYDYAPFYNLKLDKPRIIGEDSTDLDFLRIPTSKAGLGIDKPIDIDIEESYDGSANLILNDKVNKVKIVNPRFYLTDSNNYKIADRKGSLDTNIYTENNFKTEANLVKTVQSIVKLDFLGISQGGKMPVGNYTFYFKLADSDGNESDFVSESGRVVCHIGTVGNPKFIRGGQLNENSGKSIRFKLKNLDLAYNFINVYYTRTTGDKEQEVTTAHKINDSFKINGLETELNITGYEEHSDIGISEINIMYSEFESATSIENCQNMTFAGGVVRNYEMFRSLENLSLFLTPSIAQGDHIGNLDPEYKEKLNSKQGYEYYNVNNIYKNLGYWDQEIYRLGIVYIMNDYTLSPVFNIRGIKELKQNTVFTNKTLEDGIEYQEDFIIEGTYGKENAKGVFKIDSSESMFGPHGETRPLGIKVNFPEEVVNGNDRAYGLKDFTKGFFIVRQSRIPTILAQSVGIGTTKNGYLPTINVGSGENSTGNFIIESFLDGDTKKQPILKNSFVELPSSKVNKNALLCPEAVLRTEIYNSYFNSSEYTLVESKYQPDKGFEKVSNTDNHYYLGQLKKIGRKNLNKINTSLTLIEPGINLIKNGDNKFSSQAGNPIIAHENVDVDFGDYSDPENIINTEDYNKSKSKVRGIFNSYIGSDYSHIRSNIYYNIHQKGYNFNAYWKDYFRMRYNDASPFSPISDRIEYFELSNSDKKLNTQLLFRGDCYINTYTQRINWNFIDPELPTNNKIIDRYTWFKNFRVLNKAGAYIDAKGEYVNEDSGDALAYNKLLKMFTYKTVNIPDPGGSEDNVVNGLIDSEARGFKKYSERNGTFGYTQINRPDVNAVPLGHWVTYKICSNVNLAMRDIDLSLPSEEALHGMKRSFYPLQSIENQLKLPESNVISRGISKTTSNKYYFEIPDVPFIKTDFNTRIHYSNILQQSAFVNGNRVFLAKNYQDYSSEYGALVKLVEWYGMLIAIMEHGVLQIPVNERAMMKNESGESVYINTDTVLPKNPKVLSNTFGTLWEDSITKTNRYVYGLDTVGKKIWRTNGESFEVISDLKVQKFLNDNINLKESDRNETVGTHVIKTHYNAFKSDVMFSYKYGEDKWHLCWNELLEKWVTRYSWFPEFSENINNIFYTFANKDIYNNPENSKVGILYKHGFAGTLSEEGNILPTKWYDRQEPFEFEFIVAPQPGTQKIYDNFDIISNNVEPNSFIYEIVGDSYDWSHLKSLIDDIDKDSKNPDDADNGFNYMFNFPFGRLKVNK